MRPDAQVAVFVCVTPVDMRKQAATLALIVEQTLKRNIFEPALYVFSNERRDRIKIVYWQRNGLCLWSKRLEGRDRFIFPRQIEGETVTIRGAQLEELLAGFDLWRGGLLRFEFSVIFSCGAAKHRGLRQVLCPERLPGLLFLPRAILPIVRWIG